MRSEVAIRCDHCGATWIVGMTVERLPDDVAPSAGLQLIEVGDGKRWCRDLYHRCADRALAYFGGELRLTYWREEEA